jgi:hypothetical protein
VIWVLNDCVLDREIQCLRHMKSVRYRRPSTLALSCPTVIADLLSFKARPLIRIQPPGDAPNSFLNECMNEDRRGRLEFANRAAGTIQDGYRESKMIEAVF